ncbi:hypothetical protein [Sphingobacterium sp. LRF_L2]|uniref:hypothetical protein n=1 Tax=Sphingobacterium sp. LRF_L2 TaxID=3369421 RepID=UPI003F6423C1
MKYYQILGLVFFLAIVSCSDDVTSPETEERDYSRLYVSFEDYGTSDIGIADSNIRIVSRADSTSFKFDKAHVSQAKGGGPIYFNPFLQAVVQASANATVSDYSIYGITISSKSVLSNGGYTTNSYFSKVTALAYHRSSDALIVVNSDGSNSGIYLVNRPTSLSVNQRPYKKMFTEDLQMQGAAYKNNRLYVGKRGENGGLYVFENIITKSVNSTDSTANISPDRFIGIENAKNLRGMSYDTVRNVLAIVDYDDGETTGTGRILIFEAFDTKLTGTTISPTRIITGENTQLTQPVDIALDVRSTGEYLYVADRSKKIFRFKISDSGNVAPDEVITIDQTPTGLTLDSRDDSTIPYL